MHVTPDGKVKLNKTEQGKLRNASILLDVIARNHDGEDGPAASCGVDDINVVLAAQNAKAPPVPRVAPEADPPSTKTARDEGS